MKGSDLLVAALENEGVERIFGIPGEENLDVVEALRRSRIKLVVTRHEQAAAFMAATHGRLTGKPGVCLTTLGPGALNLTTGAAYALLGAMPMVMITGQKGILSRKQARFQVVDIVSAMAPLTKMAHQIVSSATIPSIVREAFRVAQQERPGPVHLELPEDIAGEETLAVRLVQPHPIDIPVANPAALDRAAELIRRAERPLLMLGAAASRPRLSDGLSDFVRRLRIPFFNTQMGKGSVAGGSGLYMGTASDFSVRVKRSVSSTNCARHRSLISRRCRSSAKALSASRARRIWSGCQARSTGTAFPRFLLAITDFRDAGGRAYAFARRLSDGLDLA
jgi:acetolactate synthase I/II/III large subunit